MNATNNATMNATKNATKNETKAVEISHNATVATNATANTTATNNATEAVNATKEGRYDRFIKKLKQNQQDAKTIDEHSSNATAVAGSKNKDAATELTIVQDFHQVRSVSNSTGEEVKPKKEAKKEGSHWFGHAFFKKFFNFFQLNW